MTRYWCTYCDIGLVNDKQKEAHEGCGHITHKVEYLPPDEDRRLDT